MSEDNSLRVTVSGAEKLTFFKTKNLVEKSMRMIEQNKAKSLLVEIDKSANVNDSAIELFNTVFSMNDFSTTIKMI
jgi:hypothetical protein